jgi:FMN phosphatase YigB (HAD superfamily)
MPSHEVIACDLRPNEIALRRDSWRALREQVEIVGRGSFRGGFRIVFRAPDEAIDAVERLVAAERVCCAWADWRLRRTADGAGRRWRRNSRSTATDCARPGGCSSRPGRRCPSMRASSSLCRELGVRRPDIEKLCDLRLAYMRQALKPRAEVIETLREVRARGLRVGLISACSGDVPLVWGDTPLADLVDVPVFSCVVGFCKPDPRISWLASSELGVESRNCLYVGDGGHDELGGAARAGMTRSAPAMRSSQPLGAGCPDGTDQRDPGGTEPF